MFPKLVFPAVLVIALAAAGIANAQMDPPQWPATKNWIPHGYGAKMHVDPVPCATKKGLHGFRTAPDHIGCWSQPLWGWDVNGFYQGPQVPSPDPARWQLPIGLIYPENGPPQPQRNRRPSKVARPMMGQFY